MEEPAARVASPSLAIKMTLASPSSADSARARPAAKPDWSTRRDLVNRVIRRTWKDGSRRRDGRHVLPQLRHGASYRSLGPLVAFQDGGRLVVRNRLRGSGGPMGAIARQLVSGRRGLLRLWWVALGAVVVGVIAVVDGAPAVAVTPPSFVSLSPARVLDTRGGAKVGDAGGTGAPFVLRVLGRGGVRRPGIRRSVAATSPSIRAGRVPTHRI